MSLKLYLSYNQFLLAIRASLWIMQYVQILCGDFCLKSTCKLRNLSDITRAPSVEKTLGQDKPNPFCILPSAYWSFQKQYCFRYCPKIILAWFSYDYYMLHIWHTGSSATTPQVLWLLETPYLTKINRMRPVLRWKVSKKLSVDPQTVDGKKIINVHVLKVIRLTTMMELTTSHAQNLNAEIGKCFHRFPDKV